MYISCKLFGKIYVSISERRVRICNATMLYGGMEGCNNMIWRDATMLYGGVEGCNNVIWWDGEMQQYDMEGCNNVIWRDGEMI